MSRDDFGFVPLGDEPGPALPISDDRAAALVAAAMERALPVRPVHALPRRRARTVIAALVLGFAATAAAAAATRGFGWLAPRSAPSAPSTAPAPSRALASRLEPELGSSAAPSAAAPPAVTPSATPAVTPSATPADRLSSANELRKQGRFLDAQRVYAEIVRASPGSKEAYVARLSAADLMLGKLGDPAGALELYRKVYEQGGYLRAQSHWGMAASYRALGRRSDEVRALEDIRALYPPGLLRQRAEARLRELGVP